MAGRSLQTTVLAAVNLLIDEHTRPRIQLVEVSHFVLVSGSVPLPK